MVPAGAAGLLVGVCIGSDPAVVVSGTTQRFDETVCVDRVQTLPHPRRVQMRLEQGQLHRSRKRLERLHPLVRQVALTSMFNVPLNKGLTENAGS